MLLFFQRANRPSCLSESWVSMGPFGLGWIRFGIAKNLMSGSGVYRETDMPISSTEFHLSRVYGALLMYVLIAELSAL